MTNLFRKIPPWGRWLFAFAGLLLVLGMFAMVLRFEPEQSQSPAKIGFVVLGDVNEPGWNESHYLGVKSACDELGVELLVRDRVPEQSGECVKAVEELAAEGAGMIYLCSYGYAEALKETVGKYPNVSFVTNAAGNYAPNLTAHFVRMHQGRYLAGALAGMKTKSGVVGYVAAMPNSEVNREINAFTLGVRRVNPTARVAVAWTGAWENVSMEQANVRRLVNEKGADVVTYHQDDQSVPKEAEILGLDYIGFNVRFPEKSAHCLGSVVCRWDIYYKNLVQRYLKRELDAVRNHWIGVTEGAVWLADVPESIGLDTGYRIAALRREIENRRHPIFHGPLYDNKGVLRVGADEVLRDEALISRMDWFVEGVEFLGE